MPGGRAQLCLLPSPVISNQSEVQGEAVLGGRCILISHCHEKHHWVMRLRIQILGADSLGSNPGPLLTAPEKVLTLSAPQAPYVDTGLSGGCYKVTQVKCSTQRR